MESAVSYRKEKPCSFCGQAESDAKSMLTVGSTGLQICSTCVESPSQEPSSLRALSCALCAKCHYQLRTTIENPRLKVCESCIRRFRKQLSAMQEMADQTAHCSFCLKTRNNVSKLIAGDRAYICIECISHFHAGTGGSA